MPTTEDQFSRINLFAEVRADMGFAKSVKKTQEEHLSKFHQSIGKLNNSLFHDNQEEMVIALSEIMYNAIVLLQDTNKDPLEGIWENKIRQAGFKHVFGPFE